MRRLISNAANGIAKELEALGYDVDRAESRRSNSQYVYASTPGDDEPFRYIAIRVSDHQNPAHRFDRVSYGDDRAESCHIEVRLDRARAWKWAVPVAVAHLTGQDEIDPNRPRIG